MRAYIPIPLIGISAFLLTSAVYAQRPPAIHGVTGTIATDATIKEEGKVANKIAVATADGLKHVFPAGKGPLSDLKPGTTVVIYYESKVTEGIVSSVEHGEIITVRYDSGKTETLQLADKAVADPRQAVKNGVQGTTRVVVYLPDGGRDKIARYFNPKS